jgi:hypothetical protein
MNQVVRKAGLEDRRWRIGGGGKEVEEEIYRVLPVRSHNTLNLPHSVTRTS